MNPFRFRMASFGGSIRARSLCRDVAESAKVDAEKVLDGVAGMPATMRRSIQKDVDHRKPPEVDPIAGPTLRGRQKHGIDVPATKKLVALYEQHAGCANTLA
jgi:ketopantoate reductase